MHRFIRVLRTASSERFLIQTNSGTDAAALDLHYLPNGSVAGTVTLLDDGGLTKETAQELLKEIDEVLLPDVSIDENNLTFTVVLGQVVGDYVPDEKT